MNKEIHNKMQKDAERDLEIIKQLKERINKAIEYIEYIGMDDTFDKVLLEILKGGSND